VASLPCLPIIPTTLPFAPPRLASSFRAFRFRAAPSAYGAEVLIVGGGPVGLALAIDLARRGIEVAVAETRASVTTAVCGCTEHY
jgi:NADPH-dependent 2,4-dienoyl-CoA reductase/sulfur reductase-like enzyme